MGSKCGLKILYACAIMHNMIIKDEKNVNLKCCFDVVNIHIKCGFTITSEPNVIDRLKMLAFITNHVVPSLNIIRL